jgi:hypothetical protein
VKGKLWIVLAQVALSFCVPILVWALLGIVAWAAPGIGRLFIEPIDILLFVATMVLGFMVLTRGCPFWVGVVLACAYFPVMYIALLYVEASLGSRLRGTAF